MILAVSLSALAGYVDAIGFLELGGFFVSFMSGNSTRAGVGVATHGEDALRAFALIGCFVFGVMSGSLIGHFSAGRRQQVVLGLVAALLGTASLLGSVRPAFAALALAMGAVNTVFEREGEVSFGVTYMTGALVKLGQRLAARLLGRDRTGWLPYLLLWGGLVSGAALGAAVQPLLGMRALVGASVGAVLLAAAVPALWRQQEP